MHRRHEFQVEARLLFHNLYNENQGQGNVYIVFHHHNLSQYIYLHLGGPHTPRSMITTSCNLLQLTLQCQPDDVGRPSLCWVMLWHPILLKLHWEYIYIYQNTTSHEPFATYYSCAFLFLIYFLCLWKKWTILWPSKSFSPMLHYIVHGICTLFVRGINWPPKRHVR